MDDDKVLNQALLGSVNYRVTSHHPRAPVDLLDDTITADLAPVTIPQLRNKPHHGHTEPFDGTMVLHRQAHDQLLAAFAELEADGLLDRILSVGESFAARLQSTVGGAPTPYLSTHALGLAFDLNPEQNVIGDPATIKETHPGSLRGLMTVFARHGFRWGGLDDPINASHFEVTTFLEPGETLPTMATVCLGDQAQGGMTVFARHGFRWGGLDEPINASHFEVTTFLEPGETRPTMAVVCLGTRPTKISPPRPAYAQPPGPQLDLPATSCGSPEPTRSRTTSTASPIVQDAGGITQSAGVSTSRSVSRGIPAVARSGAVSQAISRPRHAP